MRNSPKELSPGSEINLLLPYVTELEGEVDRLRKQGRFIEQHAWDALEQVLGLCARAASLPESASTIAEISKTVHQFAKLLSDFHEEPAYRPAHDQVVSIAVRPLIEQVFRWQQRLANAPQAVLRLEYSN
jgi:hypothetical protein